MWRIWTVNEVKTELPPVPVLLPDSRVVTGLVRGRLNDFATVVYNPTQSAGEVVTHKWSWWAVVYALNNGQALIA